MEFYNDVSKLAKVLGKEVPVNIVFTENGCPALGTTGNACLDYFSKITQSADENTVKQLLTNAWTESPLTALQIIAYIRCCKKGISGQGNRNSTIIAYKWLIENHPFTFINNLETFIELGYYKDLYHLYDSKVWLFILMFWAKKIVEVKHKFDKVLTDSNITLDVYNKSPYSNCYPIDNQAKESNDVNIGTWVYLEIPKDINWSVIKYIPPQKKDTKNKLYKIRKDIIKAISIVEEKTITDEILRKEYISPLNKMSNVVERLICDQKYQQIKYQNIPSRANKFNNHAFKKHDKERYEQYLESVKKGEVKINTSRLQPHEIVNSIHIYSNEVDAWWKGLHQFLDEKNIYFDGWIPVIDVSGSMDSKIGNTNYSCMDASRGLGILIAERNRGKFNNYTISFSQKPIFNLMNNNMNLAQKVSKVSEGMGYNTNFIAVAKALVKQYKYLKLEKDEGLNKLVVLTDMEHDDDQCQGNTTFEKFKTIIENAGYKVPKIIFWNLASRNIHYPVYSGQADVALISGFSIDILYLLSNDEELTKLTPISLLEKALDYDIYKSLKVVD